MRTEEQKANTKKYNLARSALRAAWLRWPPRAEALKMAKRPYKGNNKRQKWEYTCNSCLGTFMQKEVQVDHIIPAGSFLCKEDHRRFVCGLFCEVDELQILCKPCHSIKTAGERKK